MSRAKYNATPPTVADGQWTDHQVDAAGNLKVTSTGGAIASGDADSGNPIKVAGKYSTTLPTHSDGDRADVQVSGGGIITPFTTRANGGDAISNSNLFPSIAVATSTSVATAIQTAGLLFNGTTWDRPRSGGTGAALIESGPYSVTRVTADGQIKGSAGFVHTISIAPTTATPTAGLLTVYNSLSETGTILYSEWIFATTPGHTITLDAVAGTGIYVGFDGTLANVSCSVSFR